MKTFNQWLSSNQLCEGIPAHWNPTKRLDPDPLLSALKKIKAGDKAGAMPYDGNFAGVNVIKVKFNLDDEELNSLQQAKLITQNSEGFLNLKPSRQNLPSPKFGPPPMNSQKIVP